MASGNKIVVTPNPKGVFKEGRIRGPETPGIAMQIDVSEAKQGGRFQWEPFNGAFDAQQNLIAILLPNGLEGQTAAQVYADGDRCFLYCPIPGEEMNILLQDQSGTADDFVVGDKLIVDDGTGKFLISAGTAADKSEPFIALEAITDLDIEGVAAGLLIHAMFTGY